MTRLAVPLLAALFLAGCTTPTTRIDVHNDRGPATAALDYRDVQEAADALVASLKASRRLVRADGGVYVMTIGRVKNDTMQRFDTDILTNHIVEELSNDGSVIVTAAMAATADNRDEMIDGVRTVRGDAEFNQATAIAAGQKIAPTHSISGKVIQREVRLDNGDKQVEYYFHLRIVDLATGLQWWGKQQFIGKRTDARARTW